MIIQFHPQVSIESCMMKSTVATRVLGVGGGSATETTKSNKDGENQSQEVTNEKQKSHLCNAFVFLWAKNFSKYTKSPIRAASRNSKSRPIVDDENSLTDALGYLLAALL